MKGKDNYKKGLWTEEEDRMLLDYIQVHGSGRWNRISNITGLKRCGKSCRLRWMNYLSPSVKRGEFTEQEEDLIIRLHKLLGNRWSLIAGRVPGRTDNQVKNHWNTHLCKRLGIKKDNRKTAAVNPHSTGTDDRPPVDGVPRRECAPASSAEESQQEQPPETAGRWADDSSFCPSYNAAEDFFNGTYYYYNSFGDDDFWSDL